VVLDYRWSLPGSLRWGVSNVQLVMDDVQRVEIKCKVIKQINHGW
jgi:hypothetical protein